MAASGPEPDGLPPGRLLPAVAAVTAAVAMATLDTAIANTALPTVASDLRVDAAAAVWVVSAYQLAMIATVLPLAALGDILGHRRVYIGGLAVFVFTSLACSLSWSLPSLIGARVLQGLGASAVMGVNTALIRFIYPKRLLGRGLGINALTVAVAFAVGPTVSSAILAVAPWPWLFAINVPIGLLALALAWPNLPDTPRAGRRYDLPGALLSAGFFGLLILGLGEAAHRQAPTTVAAELGGAAALLALLLRRQRGQANPMLPVDLFRRAAFALSALTSVCAFATQGIAFVSLPFLFETVLGRSAEQTGVLMTPWPVVVGILGPLAGSASNRYPAGLLGGAGLAILAVGMGTLAFMPADPGFAQIGWRMAVCGVGFGLFQAPNLKAIMSSAPPERSGGASGVVATARLLGQSTGAASAALCFGLSTDRGPQIALMLGAVFAAAASVVSLSRLAIRSAQPS